MHQADLVDGRLVEGSKKITLVGDVIGHQSKRIRPAMRELVKKIAAKVKKRNATTKVFRRSLSCAGYPSY